MILTRYGKCTYCGDSAKVSKEFVTTIDMFNPDAKPTITPEIADDIRAWRASEMSCVEHTLITSSKELV